MAVQLLPTTCVLTIACFSIKCHWLLGYRQHGRCSKQPTANTLLLWPLCCRYAKRAKEKRLEWGSFTRDYFVNRQTLANVLLLVDASIPPTDIDLNCSSWLAESKVPFSLVFTKTDKRKKGAPKPAQNIAAFKEALLKDWEYLPYSLQTSAATGAGRQELSAYIASLRELFLKEQ